MCSEHLRSRINKGAIYFGIDDQTQALTVREKQMSAISHEEWHGYFVLRRQMIYAITTPTSLIRSGPKFYILTAFERDNNETVVMMNGMLMKAGVHNAIFQGNIVLVRDIDAFDKCDIVNRGAVDSVILEQLPTAT
jgi:hypothetical protein